MRYTVLPESAQSHKEQNRVDVEYAEQCKGEVKLLLLWTFSFSTVDLFSTLDLFSTVDIFFIVDLPSPAVDLFPILLH